MIYVENLSHRFTHHWALRQCSFSLERGDFLFLTGSSGAGKSTLLKLLYGEVPIMSGQVIVDTFHLEHIRGTQIPLLRQEVSFVFQDFKVLPEWTVFENIAIALRIRGFSQEQITRRTQAVAKALGLENKIDELCGNISGGEQQRVAIARAIVPNPKVILADEPTGNLDPTLSLRLMDIFMQFKGRGTTVIFATHNLELMERYQDTKRLHLDNGVITSANWNGAVIYKEQRIV